jgi:hypothetical protein
LKRPRLARLALALLALSPLLNSCGAARTQAERRLILTLDPPGLKPGTLIQVTARPVPDAEMLWVSGTVKVMGAPVMPFRPGEKGAWNFRTMIPVFATISPGQYEARAWGDSKDGKRYEGSLLIDVK